MTRRDALAALRTPPELEAEVLAALRLALRPSLYVTPACTPANDGCLLVVDSEGPYPHGQVLGLAIPAPGDIWRLACIRCWEPVTWDVTGRGRCPECATESEETP